MRYWRGEEPLWSAYWLLGAVGAVVALPLLVLIELFLPWPDERSLTFLVAYTAHAAFTAVAVSRSVNNVSWRIWGLLAVGSIALVGAGILAVWLALLAKLLA